MTVYAAIADLESRYPSELALLAADEATGLRDDQRIIHAIEDASVEVNAILLARYSPTDLDNLDQSSLAVLRVYTSDIALYRVALSFARLTDEIRTRYENAIKRLEAIAAGKGSLSVVDPATGGTGNNPLDIDVGQNEVVLVAPERVFTRKRLGTI